MRTTSVCRVLSLSRTAYMALAASFPVSTGIMLDNLIKESKEVRSGVIWSDLRGLGRFAAFPGKAGRGRRERGGFTCTGCPGRPGGGAPQSARLRVRTAPRLPTRRRPRPPLTIPPISPLNHSHS